MSVLIPLGITTIRRPLPVRTTLEDANVAILDILRNVREVHHLAGAGRALDLQAAAVVLVEALEGLDEEEVDGQPFDSRVSDDRSGHVRDLQIGPRQFEFPPNMPDLESPGQ